VIGVQAVILSGFFIALWNVIGFENNVSPIRISARKGFGKAQQINEI